MLLLKLYFLLKNIAEIVKLPNVSKLIISSIKIENIIINVIETKSKTARISCLRLSDSKISSKILELMLLLLSIK